MNYAEEAALVESPGAFTHRVNKLIETIAALPKDDELENTFGLHEKGQLLLGAAHLKAGRFGQARLVYTQLLNLQITRQRNPEVLAAPLIGLVKAGLGAQDIKAARADLARLKDMIPELGKQLVVGEIRILESEVLAMLERFDEAKQALSSIVSLTKNAQFGPATALMQTHLLLGWGRLFLAQKDQARVEKTMKGCFNWLDGALQKTELQRPRARMPLLHTAVSVSMLQEGFTWNGYRRRYQLELLELAWQRGFWDASLELARTLHTFKHQDLIAARGALIAASCQMALHRPAGAKTLYEKVAGIGESLKEPAVVLRGKLGIAETLGDSQPEAAAELLAEVHEAAAGLPHGAAQRTLARANNHLSRLELLRGRPDHALAALETSRALLENLPKDELYGEFQWSLGRAYMAQSDFLRADRYLREAATHFQNLEMPHEEWQVLRDLGLNAMGRASYQEADFYLDEAIDLLEILDKLQEIPALYGHKGLIALRQENLPEAARMFQEEFQAARRVNQPATVATAQLHLGHIHRLKKEEAQGQRLLFEAAMAFHQAGDAAQQGFALLEAGLLFMEAGKLDRALENLSKAEQLLEQNSAPVVQARLNRVRAGILAAFGDRELDARECFKRAIECQEIHAQTTLELAETHLEFAAFSRRNRDLKACIEHYQAAITISELLGTEAKTAQWIAELEKISPDAVRNIRLKSVAGEMAAATMDQDAGGDGLRVSMQELTALFVDIRGFTAISESLNLTEMTSFLNDFYMTTSRVVLRNKGMVNKFIGDSVLALYNVAGDLPDHAVWAVRTGVQIQEEIAKVNQRRKAKKQAPIPLGVGVNTGEVLLGSFGSVLRQDFTAIGDTINTAARLQAKAKGGEVIVSDITCTLVKDFFDSELLGDLPVKGKAQPVRMWKVKEERDFFDPGRR